MLESQGKGSTFAKVLKVIGRYFIVVMIHVQVNCLFSMELNGRLKISVLGILFSVTYQSPLVGTPPIVTQGSC